MERVPSRRHQRTPRAEAGAAMVEFVVAAMFFMLPLGLAVQALGKFADVQHTAQAAARYAAWERTVWFDDAGSAFDQKQAPNHKSGAQIRSEIAVRVFNDRELDLRYDNKDKTQARFAKGTDPLWQDTTGQPFLRDYANMTLAMNNNRPARDLVAAPLSLINAVRIPHVSGSLTPPLPTQTMVQARFQLHAVAQDSPAYKRLWSRAHGLPEDWAGFSTQAQASVLTNAWNANSAVGTLAMVKDSVPTAQALGQVVASRATGVIGLWEPTMLLHPLELGKIGVDVVPADRLR